MAPKQPAAAKKSQVDKFHDAAREHEADESEAAFDAKLKRIAKAAPTQKGTRPATLQRAS